MSFLTKERKNKKKEEMARLEPRLHGIITPQCVDKMLSNNTLLETRIQRLLDGLIFVDKELFFFFFPSVNLFSTAL